MGSILIIVAAVIVAFLLAYAIVKYLPLKFKWVASLVLLALAVFLVYKIYDGIMKPINFNKDKKVLFARVITNLKMIRDAEIAHYDITGNYTDNKDSLLSFVENAQFALIEIRDTVVKVNKGTRWQPLIVDVEQKVTDTIGYESVKDKLFKDRDYKNMFKVPGLDGKEFQLAIGKVEKVVGLEVPVFEAKIDKKSILVGKDISLVKQELEAVTSDEIKGEFISVGSLNEVTTGGNWPPFYDKQDRAKENSKD